MNRFVLKNTFIKSIPISFFNKYFYRNKKSKLCFVLETVSLFKTTSFASTEEAHSFRKKKLFFLV